MSSDEGIQLHLFEMDKYADTIDEDHIIFIGKSQTHIEFTSEPFHGKIDSKFCIKEVTEYGNMKNSKWFVYVVQHKASSMKNNVAEPERFDSMSEAIKYIETLTGKIVKFRGGG